MASVSHVHFSPIRAVDSSGSNNMLLMLQDIADRIENLIATQALSTEGCIPDSFNVSLTGFNSEAYNLVYNGSKGAEKCAHCAKSYFLDTLQLTDSSPGQFLSKEIHLLEEHPLKTSWTTIARILKLTKSGFNPLKIPMWTFVNFQMPSRLANRAIGERALLLKNPNENPYNFGVYIQGVQVHPIASELAKYTSVIINLETKSVPRCGDTIEPWTSKAGKK